MLWKSNDGISISTTSLLPCEFHGVSPFMKLARSPSRLKKNQVYLPRVFIVLAYTYLVMTVRAEKRINNQIIFEYATVRQ